MSYTLFLTYQFKSDTIKGYSDTVHCNYINKIDIESPNVDNISINFPEIDEFKFLNTGGTTGFSASRICLVYQIINNAEYAEGIEIKPKIGEWKIVDVTNQIDGLDGISDTPISKFNMINTIFVLKLSETNSHNDYDLTYINYPSLTQNGLNFGDESIFIGNVDAEIKADVYTMNLTINLPLNEFNSTTNKTWDGESNVFISEIGLYDNNDNLIGIGKLNNPIPKNGLISRSIEFSIDF